jgi:hypothetical protein
VIGHPESLATSSHSPDSSSHAPAERRDVKPPSNTFTQSGLAPHCAPRACGAIRQMFDSPVGAGKPFSSPT